MFGRAAAAQRRRRHRRREILRRGSPSRQQRGAAGHRLQRLCGLGDQPTAGAIAVARRLFDPAPAARGCPAGRGTPPRLPGPIAAAGGGAGGRHRGQRPRRRAGGGVRATRRGRRPTSPPTSPAAARRRFGDQDLRRRRQRGGGESLLGDGDGLADAASAAPRADGVAVAGRRRREHGGRARLDELGFGDAVQLGHERRTHLSRKALRRVRREERGDGGGERRHREARRPRGGGPASAARAAGTGGGTAERGAKAGGWPVRRLGRFQIAVAAGLSRTPRRGCSRAAAAAAAACPPCAATCAPPGHRPPRAAGRLGAVGHERGAQRDAHREWRAVRQRLRRVDLHGRRAQQPAADRAARAPAGPPPPSTRCRFGDAPSAGGDARGEGGGVVGQSLASERRYAPREQTAQRREADARERLVPARRGAAAVASGERRPPGGAEPDGSREAGRGAAAGRRRGGGRTGAGLRSEPSGPRLDRPWKRVAGKRSKRRARRGRRGARPPSPRASCAPVVGEGFVRPRPPRARARARAWRARGVEMGRGRARTRRRTRRRARPAQPRRSPSSAPPPRPRQWTASRRFPALHPPLREDAMRHAAVVVADGLRAHLPPLLLLLVLLDQPPGRSCAAPPTSRASRRPPLDEVLGATAPRRGRRATRSMSSSWAPFFGFGEASASSPFPHCAV